MRRQRRSTEVSYNFMIEAPLFFMKTECNTFALYVQFMVVLNSTVFNLDYLGDNH